MRLLSTEKGKEKRHTTERNVSFGLQQFEESKGVRLRCKWERGVENVKLRRRGRV